MPARHLFGGTYFWHCRLKLPNVLLHRLYHFPVIRGVGIFGIFRPFVPSRSDGTPYVQWRGGGAAVPREVGGGELALRFFAGKLAPRLKTMLSQVVNVVYK
jgi:hypothetical protein